MPVTKRRRLGAIGAASALIASFLAFGASPAAADTNQLLACFSPLTSTYSTFPLPMNGTGAPSPIDPGGGATFSDLSTAFGINSALVVAGIGANVLDFVTNPALLGSIDPLTGGDGVNTATNTTTARYTITNATPATHTATGGVTATFWIVFDGANPATLQIYAEDSPGSWSGPGTTGLHIVSSLVIPIPLSPNVSVTHNGGSPIALRLNSVPPANPAGAPTLAERNNAPLVLLNNLGVQANFYCWPGTSTGAIDPVTNLPAASPGFSPAATANVIDTVIVNVPAEAPVANNDSALVGANASVNIDVLANDTDANGDIDPASVTIVTQPTGGTATPNANGTVTYTNTNPSATTDTFTYTVADTLGAVSNVATVSVVPPTTTTTSTTTTTVRPTTPTTTPPPGPRTATGTYVTTCTGAVGATVLPPSQLTFHITGTVPGQVTAGDPVTMSKQSWTIDVPGSVLDLGVAAGLLKAGDTVNVAGTVSIVASNTAEGTRTAGPISVTLGPIVLDAFEKAAAVSVTFPVPDMTWTSVGGTIGYAMASASVEVPLGALKPIFTCAPTAPVEAFLTTDVSGAATGVPAAAASNTQAQDELPATGGSPIGPLVIGAALVAIGYLLASAARRRYRALQ